MTVKSALSIVALTAGIALSGGAYAQGMMINGAAVSETDMPAVQERCDQLSTAKTTESLSDTSDSTADNTADSSDSTGAAADVTSGQAPAVNEAQNATTTIDLDTVTLEACVAGGFVTQ